MAEPIKTMKIQITSPDESGEIEYEERDIGCYAKNVEVESFNNSSLEDVLEELFIAVSNGKRLIAAAITDKGGKLPENPKFSDLAVAISDLKVANMYNIVDDEIDTIDNFYRVIDGIYVQNNVEIDVDIVKNYSQGNLADSFSFEYDDFPILAPDIKKE